MRCSSSAACPAQPSVQSTATAGRRIEELQHFSKHDRPCSPAGVLRSGEASSRMVLARSISVFFHSGNPQETQKTQNTAALSTFPTSRSSCCPEPRDNGVDIINASAPGSTADALQRGPKACIIRQIRVRRQVRAQWTLRKDAHSFLEAKCPFAAADQIDAAFEPVTIDDNLDAVAVTHLADRPAGKRLGPTWPIQAPVETPEKRASVSTATCLPKLRNFRADVI